MDSVHYELAYHIPGHFADSKYNLIHILAEPDCIDTQHRGVIDHLHAKKDHAGSYRGQSYAFVPE